LKSTLGDIMNDEMWLLRLERAVSIAKSEAKSFEEFRAKVESQGFKVTYPKVFRRVYWKGLNK